MKSPPYRIEFTPEAGEHVKDLSARGPPAIVLVRAVGVKVRQRVLIGGKEVML